MNRVGQRREYEADTTVHSLWKYNMLYVLQNMYKCVVVWTHINQNREWTCPLVIQIIGRERNGEGSHDLGPKQRVRLCLNKETTSFHKVSNEEKYFQTQVDDLLLYRIANRIWTMTSGPGWNEVGRVPIGNVSNSRNFLERSYILSIEYRINTNY